MTDLSTEGVPGAGDAQASQSAPAKNERVYWRSPSQLASTPEFREIVEREFPEGVADGAGLGDGSSRRSFMTAVAASVAAMGLTSCRKPIQKIVPFNRRPEFFIPGVPDDYATALTVGGFGVGVVVRSNDGRPTKIEGNPAHPASKGGTSARLQAELLNLYDPARSSMPLEIAARDRHAKAKDPAKASSDAFFNAFVARREALKQAGGKGLHVVLPGTASPTVERMVAAVTAAMPQTTFHRYDAVDGENERQGAVLAFGRAVETQHDLDQCAVIASFDHDFLGVDGDSVRLSKGYAQTRKITDENGSISRLYVAEAAHTVTGSNADHRLRVAPTQILVALCALAAELGVGGDTALASALASYKGKAFAYRKKANWVPALAKDLQANSGASAVLVGPRQPALAHALAHAINAHLGNVGKSVRTYPANPGVASMASIAALARALDAGTVDTVLTIGVNPVYDAPGNLGFAAAYAKAPHRIHVGSHVDETALASTWHCNLAHELEAWGDVLTRDGTLAIQQPLIAPLYNAPSLIEVLAHLAGAEVTDGYSIVRETHARANFDSWWNQSLHDGIVAGSALAPITPSLDAARVATAVSGWQAPAAPTAASPELEVRPDNSVLDGRYSNNPWMQELPDPITKLVYDNVVAVSHAKAKALGAANGDLVTLTAGSASVTGPLWVVPGQAEDVVTVTLGYGRKMDAACEVAAAPGFDVNPLRTEIAPAGGPGLKIAKASGTYELVSAQDHGSLEGRPLFREASIGEYRANPQFAPEQSPLQQTAKLKNELHAMHHADGEGHGEKKTLAEKDLLKSLWPERDYSTGYQWGMVIDLNTCTGCNACVIACTSENNISMVGKEQVSHGREMFWNRMDRYFTTESDDEAIQKDPTTDPEPAVAHQMVPCMQCENAPCESVCPVAATTHSPEGLNDMAYNRCIGTRYCNNNCPYKVRRFNWFNFNLDVPKTQQMAFNPNVTVRARGVMEKCTYCVQRISAAKIDANKDNRKVEDGEIKTACQQGCPADAITFGDINDAESQVSKLRASNLNFAMLSELNLKPRTTYLAKIRNPNPELMGA